MSKRTLTNESLVADHDLDANKKAKQLVTDEQENVKSVGIVDMERAAPFDPRCIDDDIDLYIDSAFRLGSENQVVIFLGYHYVVLSYDPVSPKLDRLIYGPHFIYKSFPKISSIFHERVEAAFSCHGGNNEAFLFAKSDCAKIKYLPDTHMAEVIVSTTTLRIFPFLMESGFGSPEAAFESMVTDEAYLFNGLYYAIINYSESKGSLITKGLITDAFPCLRNTVFAHGIGAAFASHRPNEVYLFKDNCYALLHYTPGETDSYLIKDPEEILPINWPSLRDFLPRKEVEYCLHDYDDYPDTDDYPDPCDDYPDSCYGDVDYDFDDDDDYPNLRYD